MINIINLRIIYKLDVSYAIEHTFSKVTVTIFLTTKYIYDSDKGSGAEIKKKQSQDFFLISVPDPLSLSYIYIVVKKNCNGHF